MTADVDNQLSGAIAEFYDRSSDLWESVWGEHMHHGYYADADVTHRRAQIDMIEQLLRFGGVRSAERVLDVGCGIGGSSLYLAQKFDAQVAGVTLSSRQAVRARQRAAAHQLTPQTLFAVADALATPFREQYYDLVWSMESGEHMPDKRRFLANAYQALQPGGVFLMATWCHRPLPPALTQGERNLLRGLYRDYHLPYIISNPDYGRLAKEVGFRDVVLADWSDNVAPFWGAVARSALQPASLVGLLRAGRPTIVGALAIRHMIRGYQAGLIRFGVLRATR